MHWLWNNSVICEWTVTCRGCECDAVSELWQVEALNVTLSVTVSVNCDRSRLWMWHCQWCCQWTVTGRGCECDTVCELWQVEAVNVMVSVKSDSRWRLWMWQCLWTVTGWGCECDGVSEQWQQVEAVNVTVSVNCDRSRLWMWRCQTTRWFWWSHNSASLSYNDLSLLVNMSAHNSSNDLTARGLTTSLSLLFVLTPRNSAVFCVESVCLSVFLSSCTSVKPHSQILPMFVYTACGCGSVFSLEALQYVTYFRFCGLRHFYVMDPVALYAYAYNLTVVSLRPKVTMEH